MRASSPFLLMRAIAAHALPHTPTITDLKKRDNETGSSLGISGNVHGGEPPSGRTIYTLFVVFAMMIVAFLFGSRFHKLRRSVFMKRNLMSTLVLLLYIFVLLFIILSAVLVVGQGMRNRELCVAATWVCLVFYVAAKAVIYIFLVERIHVVRAPFVRRSRDWIYLTCLALVLVSFTGVTIGAFLTPVIHMGASDGRCHTGIPGKASIPFVVVDVLIDVILTGVFIYLLRPVMKMQGRGTISEMLRSKGPTSKTESRDTAVQRNIRTLLWKSLVGSIPIMIPTAANMIQFLITAGKELALICLSICVLDACWDVVVIHWLTSGSAAEAEKSLLQSTLVSSNPPISKRSSTTAKTLFTEERESHPATRTMPEEPQEISRAYTSVLLTPDIRIESMPDLILPRVSDDSQDLETRNIFKDRP